MKGLKQPSGRVQALLSQWFSHLSVYEDHQVTVKRQMVGPGHGVSDPVGLWRGPRRYIPNKFPGAAANCSMQCLSCSLLSSPVVCSSLPPKTPPTTTNILWRAPPAVETFFLMSPSHLRPFNFQSVLLILPRAPHRTCLWLLVKSQPRGSGCLVHPPLR